MSGIALDFIRNEENALVVLHGDSEAATQAMLRLLADEALRDKLITNGRRVVREKFSLNTFLSRLKELYNK
jgi:glycosyltransferase involved in cell wall biosynthesis